MPARMERSVIAACELGRAKFRFLQHINAFESFPEVVISPNDPGSASGFLF
jgi:hypothetical protein